jgi:hypothetical protein
LCVVQHLLCATVTPILAGYFHRNLVVIGILPVISGAVLAKSVRIELAPRVLPDIGIEVWPVDEAGGVAAEEGAGVQIAVAVAFVKQAPGVFFFGAGLCGSGFSPASPTR